MSEKRMSAKDIERLLYNDLRPQRPIRHKQRCARLLASPDAGAKLALDCFTYRIALFAGMLAAAMGGIDGFVFTAGIGENAPAIREACGADALHGSASSSMPRPMRKASC
jgi:acetate kinase